MHIQWPQTFEWDEAKAVSNLRRHRVSFEYATRVFLDALGVEMEDGRRDCGEARYITVGRIERRVFVVVYTQRTDVIRLVSARKANRREVRRYETLST